MGRARARADLSHAAMRHITMASTRASIWAAIARLVVLPVFTAHTTLLLMSTLGSLVVASHPAGIAMVTTVAVAVEWTSTTPGRIGSSVVHGIVHHPRRSTPAGIGHHSSAHGVHAVHATPAVVTPALLPLLPAITIVVTLGTKAHAHPSDRRHALHAEV